MAKFQVVLQPEAERNVLEIFAWISTRTPQGAVAWYRALENAVNRLRQSADCFPIAPESRHFDHEIRDLLFKTRHGLPYRLLFTINESEVNIVYVRGPGQDLVSR